jgi:hypothetical protein
MADVILQVTVPDAHVARTVEVFTAIADKHMRLEVRGSQDMPDGSDFNGEWDFRIDAQQVGETTKQFCQRVLRELGKAVINLVDKTQDRNRYQTEITAVVPPASDVPDNVLI